MTRPRKFVPPIRLKLYGEHDFCPNLGHVSKDPFFVRFTGQRRTGGTMRTRSWEVQVKLREWYRAFSFCWRPDVTLYYLGFSSKSRLRQLLGYYHDGWKRKRS